MKQANICISNLLFYPSMYILVIVLTRAAPALQYHFLFFFLSWACCLQLCSYDHLREKRWYLAAVQAIKSRFFLVMIYRKYPHSLFSSLPLYYAGSPKVPPRVFGPLGPKTLRGQQDALYKQMPEEFIITVAKTA